MSFVEVPVMNVRKQLNVRAVDNFGHTYAVELELKHSPHWGWKWVLVVVNTPGRWYLTTLLNDDPDLVRSRLYVDYGQRWMITNFDLVMKAALKEI